MTTEMFQGIDENGGNCDGMTGSKLNQTTP